MLQSYLEMFKSEIWVYRVDQAVKLAGPEALELIATGEATALEVIREAKKAEAEAERKKRAAKAG